MVNFQKSKNRPKLHPRQKEQLYGFTHGLMLDFHKNAARASVIKLKTTHLVICCYFKVRKKWLKSGSYYITHSRKPTTSLANGFLKSLYVCKTRETYSNKDLGYHYHNTYIGIPCL